MSIITLLLLASAALAGAEDLGAQKQCQWRSAGRHEHVETFYCDGGHSKHVSPVFTDALSDVHEWALSLEDDRKNIESFGFYHTTTGLLSEYQQITAKPDSVWKMSYLKEGSISIPMLTTHDNSPVSLEKDAGKTPSAKKKMFIVAGEHAREVISTELALKFVRDMNAGDERTKQILANVDITLVPIVNMEGRRAVDRGEFCKRTNGNNVDLNRNWDTHYGENKEHDAEENNGGVTPFDQAETKMLRDYAQTWKPDGFLCMHAGQEAIFTPWAYDAQEPPVKDLKDMEKVIHAVNTKSDKGGNLVIDAKLGPAGKKLGYYCSGTSLDWFYHRMGVKSFAFEIYNGLAGKPNLADMAASFLETGVSEEAMATDEFCIEKYYPKTKAEYDSTNTKWSEATKITVECSMMNKC